MQVFDSYISCHSNKHTKVPDQTAPDLGLQCMYSKTCFKRPLINRQNKVKTNGSLMKVESIAECSLGAFCDTFDLH